MIPALLLIISAVVFRIATGFFGQPSHSIGWLNFAPLAAIALCAAAYFPWKYKFTVPMIALLVLTRRREVMGAYASGRLTMATAIAAATVVLVLNLLLVLQLAGVPLPVLG